MMSLWIYGTKGEPAKIVIDYGTGLNVSKEIGKATQAQAEFTAIIEALNLIKKERKKTVIFTDSNIVYGQLIKGWKIKANVQLANKAKNLLSILKPKVEIRYIKKQENLARKRI